MPRHAIEDVLKKKHLYFYVLNLKFEEAKFFLTKTREEYDKVNILSPKCMKSFTEKDVKQAGILIAFYSSAFYSAIAGFFDSLAIYHTKNRENWYRKIHFRKWLDWQLRNHSSFFLLFDQYLIELKDNVNRWLGEFLDSRNLFIHSFHVFARMGRLLRLEARRGQPLKVKMFEVETISGRKEIVQYFQEIMGRLNTLTNTINIHVSNEYAYSP